MRNSNLIAASLHIPQASIGSVHLQSVLSQSRTQPSISATFTAPPSRLALSTIEELIPSAKLHSDSVQLRPLDLLITKAVVS
ncbi:hypothetical protein PMAYCL1PPCAC_31771 [Pristionchus mayeri]|uniref:Uncharacterized protein n=1 Tax=Pristionchus mayeri TaxID=1317129 RepID=A0AAN5IFT4_9BILA|nr:hypothetical protein PMAYCL1PPCAC_31771 [Pristionchus mayeri]